MAWVRIDDHFADHPKVRAAGPIAVWIHVQALCYASRYLTDGFIPDAVISGFTSGLERIGIETGFVGETRERALASFGEDAKDIDWPNVLISAGLWEKKRGGFQIHDYLDFNPSKVQILADRERRKEAGSRGGRVTALARAQAHTQGDAEHSGTAAPENPRRPRTPLPSPRVPVRTLGAGSSISQSSTSAPSAASAASPAAPALYQPGGALEHFNIPPPTFSIAEVAAEHGLILNPPRPPKKSKEEIARRKAELKAQLEDTP